MANKSTSKSNEAYFTRYKTQNRYAANRKRKLEKQLKLQPNNKQIALAIGNIGGPRRGTPKVPYWSHSMIQAAMLVKLFTGKFDKHYFSPKQDDSDAARKERNTNLFTLKKSPGRKISEFSMALRAHDGRGNLVWA